jgi:hypothetical protein
MSQSTVPLRLEASISRLGKVRECGLEVGNGNHPRVAHNAFHDWSGAEVREEKLNPMADIDIAFGGETHYLNNLLFDLFEATALREGTQKELPGGAVITLKPMESRKGAGFLHVVEIVLTLSGNVGTSLAAAYLCDKLKKHHAREIRTLIERREIQVTKSGLIKIIEERIEHEEKRD